MAERLGLFARARAASARVLARYNAAARPSDYPPSPFDAWDAERVQRAIQNVVAAQTIDTSGNGQAVGTAPGEVGFANPRAQQDPIVVNRQFYTGDHWQNGSGWIGPHPQRTDVAFSEAMQEIAMTFTPKNVIAECVDRHALGVVGRAFQWSFVPRRLLKKDEAPNADEARAIGEVTALMRNWLMSRKIPSLIRDAVATLLLAERSAIRLYVPAGLTDENDDGTRTVSVDTIEQALGKIYPEHPMPDTAAVVCDPDTKLEAGVWQYETVEDDDAGKEQRNEYVGLCFLDEKGTAVVRLMSVSADTDENTNDVEMPLGGRLPMFEMRRRALITSVVQQQQRALNLANSMVPRNVVTGGFLERIILDAQMPGRPEIIDGVKTGRWIHEPFYTGAGTTNFIAAAITENEDGETSRGSPSVQFREPIAPTASIDATETHYLAILDECAQLHVVMSGDSNASGKSREEARTEFVRSLLRTQPEVEAALSFVLETALAMAEALANTPGQYTNALRVNVRCVLDTGPLSADERASIEASIGKTLSTETAQTLLGIEDTEAERARMLADPQARANFAKIVGDALGVLTAAGATLEGAARLVGLTEAQLEDLLTPSTEPAPEDTPPVRDPMDDPSGTRPRRTLRSSNPGGGRPNQNNNNRPARATSSSGSRAGGGSSSNGNGTT